MYTEWVARPGRGARRQGGELGSCRGSARVTSQEEGRRIVERVGERRKIQIQSADRARDPIHRGDLDLGVAMTALPGDHQRPLHIVPVAQRTRQAPTYAIGVPAHLTPEGVIRLRQWRSDEDLSDEDLGEERLGSFVAAALE
jgi:hypothetical protein